MEQSILKSTKKVLHIGPDDDSFDLDVMTHINAAFSTLNDLGLGPLNGFFIEDDSTEWGAFLDENPVQLNRVKNFVFLSVRLIFDPPQQSFVIDALQKQLDEITWRLSVSREGVDWVDPDPLPADEEYGGVLDGGTV